MGEIRSKVCYVEALVGNFDRVQESGIHCFPVMMAARYALFYYFVKTNNDNRSKCESINLYCIVFVCTLSKTDQHSCQGVIIFRQNFLIWFGLVNCSTILNSTRTFSLHHSFLTFNQICCILNTFRWIALAHRSWNELKLAKIKPWNLFYQQI